MTVRNSILSIATTSATLYSNIALLISTGFAMFAMFFGSGNIVFPILLGGMVDSHYLFAVMGLFITAVFVPFLGLYAIYLFDGDYKAFFQRLGKKASFIIPTLVLALIGPFGVIPRCITVGYGSIELLFPNFPFVAFSILMCVIIFLLTLDPRRIVMVVGAFMTPLLLSSLAVIAFQGIRTGHLPTTQIAEHSSMDVFVTGFFQGYYTLDLVAAFFFASVIIKYIQFNIKQKLSSQGQQNMIILGSMIVGAGLLALIYMAFVYLGGIFTDILSITNPERNITIIAHHVLGTLAGPIVSIAILLAVLTTAVALTSVASTFLRNEILSKSVYTPIATLMILAISFFVSTFKFTGIASFLGPILVVLYPGLIVLTILNIGYKTYNIQTVKTPVYATFIIVLIWTLFFST